MLRVEDYPARFWWLIYVQIVWVRRWAWDRNSGPSALVWLFGDESTLDSIFGENPLDYIYIPLDWNPCDYNWKVCLVYTLSLSLNIIIVQKVVTWPRGVLSIQRSDLDLSFFNPKDLSIFGIIILKILVKIKHSNEQIWRIGLILWGKKMNFGYFGLKYLRLATTNKPLM